jgi:hypothetical protein
VEQRGWPANTGPRASSESDRRALTRSPMAARRSSTAPSRRAPKAKRSCAMPPGPCKARGSRGLPGPVRPVGAARRRACALAREPGARVGYSGIFAHIEEISSAKKLCVTPASSGRHVGTSGGHPVGSGSTPRTDRARPRSGMAPGLARSRTPASWISAPAEHGSRAGRADPVRPARAVDNPVGNLGTAPVRKPPARGPEV